MGDWDFADGLEGDALADALSSGGTAEDWAFVDAVDEEADEGEGNTDTV
ncbi:hypothetical protein [Leucobacter sp. cx-169]|nr:hypothetical protein [Leucobacter sp. cx-169]MBC9927262.1 hypothetical protein [Leucobacter sp. cx-169]